MSGSTPLSFISLIFTIRLDRPPRGFFFHPQGSNWPWTLPDNIIVNDPAEVSVQDQNKIQKNEKMTEFFKFTENIYPPLNLTL